MAATAYYQNRERAFNRTNRIHKDINRASAYILDSDNAPISSTYTSNRSSSLSRDVPRYVDPSNAGYRFKDKFSNESLRRTTNIPIQMSTTSSNTPSKNSPKSGQNKVYSKDFNPYSETARYKREQEMKEIHDEFMKNWNVQQNKMGGNEEKKTRAYHKIMGTAVSSLEDRDFTRQTIGDIFKDMSKFSTKTVAALSTLDTQGLNKNKKYNWRKEIEKYETTGQLERDARIRNIEIRNKRNGVELGPTTRSIRRDKSPSYSPVKNTTISRIAHETKIEAPPKEEKVSPYESRKDFPEPVKSQETPKVDLPKPSFAKKRTKSVKKKIIKEEEKIDEEDKTSRISANLAEVDEEKTVPQPLKDSDDSKNVDEEEEDVDGTKKLKNDFANRMASLDAEMTEGRSNLARIRERIRKAKKGLMEIEI